MQVSLGNMHVNKVNPVKKTLFKSRAAFRSAV